jgi:hypothetical protein
MWGTTSTSDEFTGDFAGALEDRGENLRPNIENVNPVHYCTRQHCKVQTGSEIVCLSG